ncbi:hypothetical protein ACIBCM_28490 [Streptomyces sp. NPDC051018]|uniref:hypothetical protein n=1 Tax=Streptomyces sp. NPDC051018 TaxID=3365639 RepID=UPI003794DE75
MLGITPEDLAHISPHLIEHINRFGEYSTHELGIQPEAYDPKLDVGFTPLRDQDLAAAGFGQVARPAWSAPREPWTRRGSWRRQAGL